MQKRIFHAIWMVAFAVLAASLTVFMSIMYSYFTQEQFRQLRNDTTLARKGVALNGISYLKNLETIDFRITWITPEGKILFDNAAFSNEMENHLEREEIQDALRSGYGESSRYSSTLSERQLYTAQRMDDGTVLRLSINQATIWNLLMRFFLPVFTMLLISLAVSYLIASRLSQRIVSPINHLDLDNPLKHVDDETCTEIRPLLISLDEQRRQIQRDKEELEKTSLIRQEFTANASHELKTPLHVISGYAELLESGMVKEEDSRVFAGRIRFESQRMSKLVEDIIELSSLDGGAIGMKRERTDLCRIAQNAVDSLSKTAEDADVTIRFRGEHAGILGIPQVLYSLVFNLCLNAVKYSKENGQVQVEVRKEDKYAVLTVQDNGIGIPREEQERIFERFYRVDKSRSKEVGGTGLGLSIVKHAAKIHNATVTVRSTPGEGSVFTVLFPNEA